ncbi:MAG: hypothetical protein KF689_06770 [Gemmatimonadaceae bacterium]|nr:hypothetical protein [Gemmatimonadaceae bacterium]MCW5825122.1 hypothetical protein [Gemmatimonadaceae bacterium]
MISGEPPVDWRIPIVIGCDTDPDRSGFVGALPSDRLVWRGMLEGIPALKDAVRNLRDDAGCAPRFTWLLRADEQVRDLMGSYSWCLEAHGAFLSQLVADGDALGWHPHFWRLDRGTSRWYQEVEDREWQVAMLHAAHHALQTAGLSPASARMGWTYHTSETFNTLDALGVRLEFSPFPGLRSYRSRPATRSENQFDWSITPTQSFFASRRDPRKAAGAGEPACRMLTLPCFVAQQRAWGFVAGVQMARKSASPGPIWDAIRRPSYVINLTARPTLFAPLVNQLRDSVHSARAGRRPAPAFATYFHPDELIPNRSTMYALQHVRENIVALVDCIRSAGASPAFVTADQYVNLWGAETRSTS